MEKQTKVRAVYVATVTAVLGLTIGFALAAVLSSTNVAQTASFYQGGNSGVTGYTTPSLQVTTTPAATTTCTSSTQTVTSSGGTAQVILSSTTGGTVCTTGDFSEEFVFSFAGTVATQTDTFTITTQVGAGTVQTNTGTVTVGTGTSSSFAATVDVFVDYGAVNPPAGGVSVLDVVIQ
ncbi:MAG: hypothetical protein L3K09_00560 [Thermoplasmata archaeon]|nr:hypothetical protein [Thermoplasmata archaeon]